jgi:hypothetical protein
MDQLATRQGEPRPRDFTARFSRARMRGVGETLRRRSSGRLAVLLAGLIALPAFAAPDGWAAFDVGDAGQAEVVIAPMPFEKPGSSFPGSAFYYLTFEEPAPSPGLGEGIHSDADIPDRTDPYAGPVARALRVDNSGVDRTRALQCLTAAVYYEAASEPDSGQRAVAQVVLNRVAHPSYPNTVCGVVYQGSERRTGCQFSFTCDGSLARKPSRMFWLRAEDTARAALGGYVHAPAGLATHYHTIHVSPYWAPSLDFLGTIGLHRFYRFKGKAGQPGAFRFAYLGGEPAARPHARLAIADAQSTETLFDPVAVQKAYEDGLKAAVAANLAQPTANGLHAAHAPAEQTATAAPAPPPSYSEAVRDRGGDTIYRGDNLPEAHGIKPEYRNSGRWIAQPGT